MLVNQSVTYVTVRAGGELRNKADAMKLDSKFFTFLLKLKFFLSLC